MDELVRRVKEGLDLTAPQIANDIEAYAGKITTSSPEALQYFIEGQKCVREFDTMTGVRYLEKAVEIDPEFAMAYRALASAHNNLGQPAEGRKYIKKALEFSARLPENERLLIEGQALLGDEDFPRGIEVLEKLVKIYPAHSIGQSALAAAYRRAGNIDKAIEHQELAARIQKGTIFVTNLAYYYSLRGRYREAEEICRSFLRDNGENPAIDAELMYSYLHQRKLDLALAEAERIAIAAPDLQDLAGDVLLIRDDLDGAEKVYRQVLEKDRDTGRTGLYELALIRGRYKDALSLSRENLEESKGNSGREAEGQRILALTFEKAGSFGEAEAAYGLYLKLSAESRNPVSGPGMPYLPSQQENDLFIKGRIQAEMGSSDEAQRSAGELKALVDKGINTQQLRWPEYIQGVVAFGKRDYRKSAELFQRACGRLDFEAGYLGFYTRRNQIEFDHAMYFDALARALYESGDMKQAGKAYEKVTLLTFGRMLHGDLYSRAFYMLGKIAQKQGDKTRARENYRKFLVLWKDADPGLPEVDDARARLAALK